MSKPDKMMFPGIRKIAIFLFAAFILALPLTFLAKPMKVQSNMLSLLPLEKEQIIKQKAFDHLTNAISQRLIILFGAESKKEAYDAAKLFYKNIQKTPFIEKIELEITAQNKDDIVNFYSPYRHQILSESDLKLLSTKNGETIQNQALQNIFMPVNSNFGGNIAQDPFSLTSNFLGQSPLLQTNLFPYKDILFASYKQKYYAFSSIVVSKDIPFSINELEKVIKSVENAQSLTQKQFKNTEIIITGTPIHSYIASQTAVSEISLIGFISTIAIFILICFTFRSFKPFIYSTISIAAGFYVAFITTNFIFGEVHLLTIIFGTTLVGGVDYSFHFFSEYFNKDKKNGHKIIKRILPGLTIGLLTSVISYVALFFTPFPGLQQIAWFSTIGLIASFLVVVLFFPDLYHPKKRIYSSPLLSFSKNSLIYFQKKISAKKAYAIIAILLALSFIALTNLKVNDDIRLLYSSPKYLMDREILSRQILAQNKSIQFVLVTAKTEQEVLEKELSVRNSLQELVNAKYISNYQALSQLIPPISQQKTNLLLVKENLMRPYLEKQSKILGLNSQQIQNLKNELNQTPIYLTPKDILHQDKIGELANILWLGKIGKEFGSIILLEGVKSGECLQPINNPKNGIFVMNKLEDISNIFKEYRTISFMILIGVYVLTVILLIFRYSFLRSLFITLPPLTAGIISLAITSSLGYPINLFNILALFLVIGVGIDYTVFFDEAKDHESTTALAVLLSAITTLLSFGLLAFSSFPVISSFGMTVLFGILFSYLLSPMATLGRK